MNYKRIIVLCCVMAIAIIPFNAVAEVVDAATARTTAMAFMSKSLHPSLKSAAGAELKLIHAEPSRAVANANAYYAFNITGGGFVIVAGDDRARDILGYSDSGLLDFDRLPSNLRALLNGYADEVNYLHSHPELTATATPRLTTSTGVAPLIKSHWGQEMPYYLQCPTYNGEYCVVGCVATAMSQVMHYWQYPTTSPELNAYFCYDIGQTLPAMEETDFEYGKMLNSYCHWDYDQGKLIQDSYTDEQAQAVAKLARYCGQAVKMGYSPDGSGAYVTDQLSAMKKFGYSSSADDVSRDSNWSHEMLTGVEPPTYVVVSMDDITSPNELMVLGETFDINASNVIIRSSHPNINLIFNLYNENGVLKAKSQACNITTASFEQGSNLDATITLPKTLDPGCYDLKVNYYISSPRITFFTNNQGGQLNVVGHIAKYDSAFTIDDVTTCIQYLLDGTYEILNIDDVTELINHLLTH